jgi:DNA-binding HxlR family transcriptional regulator
MQRKNFGEMQCPIARSLERVGEWWGILILRDAFHGLTRFDEFQKSLGIAPNMLTRRLNALVEAGLLQRRRYSERPPRDEYVLTERGRDFRPVLVSLLAWGNRHFAPEGAAVQLVNRRTGAPVEPVLVDPATGRPVVSDEYAFVPGPAATKRVRQKYDRPISFMPPGCDPGVDPAIHTSDETAPRTNHRRRTDDVDGRDKPGHDGKR